MICVSIGRGRHRHMIAEHAHLVEQGAKLVELRLDYISGPVNVRRIIKDRPGPVIITCRRAQDGGKYSGSEEQRQLLLRTAVAEGVEYVDLEEDVATNIPRFGKTKRVLSYHHFRKTPDDLEEIHARMCELDPDIVKVATLANHTSDNTRMLSLVQRSEVPTVGICMGDIGVPTRILTGSCGSPFTYATFHHERALAPGQLTFAQMRDVYDYDRLNSETEVYGVIADPIGHSLSPLIHNAAFRAGQLNRVYLPFRVPKNDLGTFLSEDAPALKVRGLSVTIPHKEAVLRHLSKVDGAVRAVGACNTIVFEGGKLVGYNTDYRAAMDCLERLLTANDEPPRWEQRTALLLGAGGVAKAIAHGLRRRGSQVVIASRTNERSDALAKRIDGRSVDWAARHMVGCDLLINCTPLGMHPNVDESPFDKHHLKPNMLVFDTVYNPESTLLIKDARNRRCRVITGVEMFIRQAVLQYQLFTGQPGPADLMRDVFKRAIGPVKY